MTRDGVLLDYRWVVAPDGTLQLSFVELRGLPHPPHARRHDAPRRAVQFRSLDGAGGRADAGSAGLRRAARSRRRGFYSEFGVPWLADDPHARFRTMTDERGRARSWRRTRARRPGRCSRASTAARSTRRGWPTSAASGTAATSTRPRRTRIAARPTSRATASSSSTPRRGVFGPHRHASGAR